MSELQSEAPSVALLKADKDGYHAIQAVAEFGEG